MRPQLVPLGLPCKSISPLVEVALRHLTVSWCLRKILLRKNIVNIGA